MINLPKPVHFSLWPDPFAEEWPDALAMEVLIAQTNINTRLRSMASTEEIVNQIVNTDTEQNKQNKKKNIIKIFIFWQAQKICVQRR